MLLFYFAGTGNAATFRQYPIIFAHSPRQGAGVIGFSAGLPRGRSAMSLEPETNPGAGATAFTTRHPYGLLLATLIKGVALAAVFFGLFPVASTALANGLPTTMGVLIPLVSIAYLMELAFLLSAFRKKTA